MVLFALLISVLSVKAQQASLERIEFKNCQTFRTNY